MKSTFPSIEDREEGLRLLESILGAQGSRPVVAHVETKYHALVVHWYGQADGVTPASEYLPLLVRIASLPEARETLVRESRLDGPRLGVISESEAVDAETVAAPSAPQRAPLEELSRRDSNADPDGAPRGTGAARASKAVGSGDDVVSASASTKRRAGEAPTEASSKRPRATRALALGDESDDRRPVWARATLFRVLQWFLLQLDLEER